MSEKKEPPFYNLIRTALPEDLNVTDLPDRTVASINLHIGLYRPYIDLQDSQQKFHYAANEHIKFVAYIPEKTDIEALTKIQEEIKEFVKKWTPIDENFDIDKELQPLGDHIDAKS